MRIPGSTAPWLLVALAVTLHTGAARSAEPLRYVLNSADENFNSGHFELTAADVGHDAGTWSVFKHVLHGGKQEGVEIVEIESGPLYIKIALTRGMSILEVRSGELRLGWDSPVKEVVHPQFVNLHSRGGLGWLDGFNEWMVRCGLEFAGHPGLDTFVDNTGAEAEMELTLHGKIGNIPASEVELLIDADPPHRITLRGIVHERMFYGPKLELAAELSVVPGERSFRISDVVTNHGASPQEFQLIYHANFGAPLLEEGARVVAPVRRIAPMNAHAAGGIDDYDVYAAPTLGFIEQVYLIHPYANRHGRTMVLLTNGAGDAGASLSWPVAELPYLTIWKNTAAEADGYVTGIEPATGFPFHRRVERAAGRLPVLAPGESRSFTIDVGLHVREPEVSAKIHEVELIQHGQPTEVDREPPSIDVETE